MIEHFAYTIFIYAYFGLTGLPLCFYFLQNNKLRNTTVSTTLKVGLSASSPLFGTALHIYLSTLVHALGINDSYITLTLSIPISLIFFAAIYNTSKNLNGRIFKYLFCGLVLATILASISFFINSLDLIGISFDSYFPLTNDDTFAYLGHIDQLRIQGSNDPILTYAAGFSPLIEHAFGGRDAVVSFMAFIANTWQIESHTAFFVSQRLALLLLTTGIFSLLLIITGSYFASFLGFAISVFGNFFLHQILQQFSSSSFGSVLSLLLLLIFSLNAKEKRLHKKINIHPISIGFLSGLLLLTSPETASVFLLASGLWLMSNLSKRASQCIINNVAKIALGFFVATWWSLPKTLPFVFAQFKTGVGEHPGNWFANPLALQQAMGLGFTSDTSFTNINVFLTLIIISSTALFFFAIYILWKSNNERTSPIIFFALFALFIVFVLYLSGRGYAMLKVIDYFSMLPPIIFGTAFNCLIRERKHLSFKKYGLTIYILFFYFFCQQAYLEKISILYGYNRWVKETPNLTHLKLENIPGNILSSLVIADFHRSTLNLFLYINRFSPTQIAFDQSESHRFRPEIAPRPNLPFVRLNAPGYRSAVFADITHTSTSFNNLHQVGYNNTIRIIESGWLPPEGRSAKEMFRWLNSKGSFILYSDSSTGRDIQMNIYPGPDLLSENTIELKINGQTIRSIPAAELPIILTDKINNLQIGENLATLSVLGESGGLRQISVSAIRIRDTE